MNKARPGPASRPNAPAVSIRGVAREGAVAAIAAPFSSALIVVIVAVMSASIGITAGRLATSQETVMRTLEEAGTRVITIAARADNEINGDLIDLATSLHAVEWVGAAHFETDVRSSAVPVDGQPVALRRLWTSTRELVSHAPNSSGQREVAIAAEPAMEKLGLPDGLGSVVAPDGRSYEVMGPVSLPAQLADQSASILLVASGQRPDSVDTLTVLVKDVSAVDRVSDVLTSSFPTREQGTVTISTSKELRTVRNSIESHLNRSDQSLTIAITALSGVLCCAVSSLSVLHKRRDFGRRRALGATRTLVVSLIVAQTLTLSSVGAVVGLIVSWFWLTFTDSGLPPPRVVAAAIVLSTSVAVISSVIPGAIAARRDPVRELRTP